MFCCLTERTSGNYSRGPNSKRIKLGKQCLRYLLFIDSKQYVLIIICGNEQSTSNYKIRVANIISWRISFF